MDLDAVMWLEDYLINCKNTVVVVSHAREFLNVTCTDIIHFFDYKITYYKGHSSIIIIYFSLKLYFIGNFDSFDKAKQDALKN